MRRIVTILCIGLGLLGQHLHAQTSFQSGDIAIVGYKTNLSGAPSSCGNSYATDDVVAFLTFKDITPNTKIIITDCGYNGSTNTFRSGEGIAEFTRTGATIPAGSIFYIAFGNAPAICGSSASICSSGWSVASVQGADLAFLDLNSTVGDQLFILQGTFTTPTQFTGTFIYGMTTSGVWNFQNNATSSDLPPALNCLNFVSSNTDNSRYNGPFTPNTRTTHLVNIYNTNNWTTNNVLTTPNCPANPNFTFNGLPASIVIQPEPPNGNAGPNQNICGTTATMAATGTGTWSVIQGSGNFSSLTDPNAVVTGLSPGINIFRWTLTNCQGISEVTITATPNVTPSVSITSNPSTTTLCAGTSVTFTATATNGGSNPSYQWKINGNNVGTNAPTFTTNALQNNDQVSVVMTSNANCANPTTVTSNVLTFTVNNQLTPSVSISATPNTTTLCAGTSVTFTATAINGGSNPSYQWKINGSNVGTNSATFTTSSLQNNDQVSVTLTSSEPCANPAVVNSNVLTFTINNQVTPSVSISANPSSTSICAGTTVTFTATPTNGGSNPSYQWRINGNPVGTNSSTFTTNTLQNNDQVSVVMTSNATCANPNVVNSNILTYTVSPVLTPSITISTPNNLNEVCKGTELTFTATITNGGSNPVYQWLINGNGWSGANTSSLNLNTSNLNDNVTVQALLTSNANCLSVNTAQSNSINFTLKECRAAELFIPEAFTPSQAGRNATFKIEGDEHAIRNFKCQIFDRFGNLLYETNNFTEIKNIGWNGKHEGNELPTGVYFWQIIGIDQNGNTLHFQGKQRGTLLLVR